MFLREVFPYNLVLIVAGLEIQHLGATAQKFLTTNHCARGPAATTMSMSSYQWKCIYALNWWFCLMYRYYIAMYLIGGFA